MRRGEDADVDVVHAVAADGTHVAELQDAQELRLQAERHVADLVEQQRPAVGLGEQALAGLDRAGEPAANVPEELALEQLLRDGRRVDRHEGPVARALRAWIARATSSLPTPVSPVMSTGAVERATKSRIVWRARMAGPVPTSAICPALETGAGTLMLSLGCCRPSSASVTTRLSSSASHGFTTYWKAPRLMASTAWWTPPAPVMMMNGRAGCVRRTRSSSSSPLMPSITTSQMTASKVCLSTTSMAAAASAASSHT